MLVVGFTLIDAGELRFKTSSIQFSEGIGIARIPLERINPVADEQVTIQSVAMDAIAGIDFVAIDEVYTFGATETDISIAVKIIDNPDFETDRQLKLTLSDPVGLTLGIPSEILLTIADNDDLQTAGFGSSATNLYQNGYSYQGLFDQGPLTVTTNNQGRIILGGGFSMFNGQPMKNIAQLMPDGRLDSTFDPGQGVNGRVWALAAETDNQVVIGGDFTSVDGVARNRIARVNSNGKLDAQFDPGAGADGLVESVEVMSDGRILVGGFFTKINEIGRTNVAILSDDGLVDPSFDPETPPAFVGHVARRAGDHILLGGEVVYDAGNPVANITNSLSRYDLTGARDTGFQVSVGDLFFNRVSDLVVQPDGKIVVCGLFLAVNGVPVSCIARLNANGDYDETFDVGSGASYWVFRVALQSDGKILLCGWFESVDGQPRLGVARLNIDGSLDETFDPRGGANGFVYSAMPMMNGQILLTGGFSKFDGYDRFRFATLNQDGSIQTTSLSIGGYSLQSENEIQLELAVEPGRDFRVFSTEDFGGRTSILTNQTARRSIQVSQPNDGGAKFYYVEQGF